LQFLELWGKSDEGGLTNQIKISFRNNEKEKYSNERTSEIKRRHCSVKRSAESRYIKEGRKRTERVARSAKSRVAPEDGRLVARGELFKYRADLFNG
jgi:hypothetical protein